MSAGREKGLGDWLEAERKKWLSLTWNTEAARDDYSHLLKGTLQRLPLHIHIYRKRLTPLLLKALWGLGVLQLISPWQISLWAPPKIRGCIQSAFHTQATSKYRTLIPSSVSETNASPKVLLKSISHYVYRWGSAVNFWLFSQAFVIGHILYMRYFSTGCNTMNKERSAKIMHHYPWFTASHRLFTHPHVSPLETGVKKFF